MGQPELCEALWIERATSARVIKPLKKLGLVRRFGSAEDRRRNPVTLMIMEKLFRENGKG